MQKTIRLIRERIEGELHRLRYDMLYFGTLGSLADKSGWFKSELEAITTEWAGIRVECKNSYHKDIIRKEDGGFCSDCGIPEFEFIFEPDI